MDKFDDSDLVALVVEDDPTTRLLLTRLLSAMGAKEVITAKDGGEGLRVAFERRPGIVICDVEMSPVDGLAFLGGLRASITPEVAAIPVVMFTANTLGDALQRAKDLGVSGYMVKPFNPKGFASYVKEVLGRKYKEIPLVPPG